MTGTIFPVTINLQVYINALYDTGATRSCMNYDTLFNLGLDLDEKPAPCVRTASGTDMGAIGFATLTFAINKLFFNPIGKEPDKTSYIMSRFLCPSLYGL